jgi:hypothetical protein
MTTRSHLAVAVMVMACLQAGPLLAQSAPAPDTAATPAPAAPPAASTDKAATSNGKSASEEPAKPKTKFRIQMSAHTREQIDHSIKTRTVPSRYRNQVPKEYQKYIPFER